MKYRQGLLFISCLVQYLPWSSAATLPTQRVHNLVKRAEHTGFGVELESDGLDFKNDDDRFVTSGAQITILYHFEPL